jgi:hypothetical protein
MGDGTRSDGGDGDRIPVTERQGHQRAGDERQMIPAKMEMTPATGL